MPIKMAVKRLSYTPLKRKRYILTTTYAILRPWMFRKWISKHLGTSFVRTDHCYSITRQSTPVCLPLCDITGMRMLFLTMYWHVRRYLLCDRWLPNCQLCVCWMLDLSQSAAMHVSINWSTNTSQNYHIIFWKIF